MPVLGNRRHERLARALAKGNDPAAAYQLAGYRCTAAKAREKGWMLSLRPDVTARVKELAAAARRRASPSKPGKKAPRARKPFIVSGGRSSRGCGGPTHYAPAAHCPRAKLLAERGLTEVEIAFIFG